MRKFNYLLFALAVALILTGCDNKPEPDGDDKQITLPNQTEKEQLAYADEESTGGFSFVAKADWTATVAETTARALPVSWLRLLHNGVETYSGVAGSFTLVVEMDTNYSGETRSATITIVSGSDDISITVTQNGTTEQGKAPEMPRLITAIKETATFNSDYYGSGNLYQPLSFEFKYDEKDYRLKELHIKDSDNEWGNYVYTYDYSIFSEIRVSDNYGAKYVGALNNRGSISNMVNAEDEYSEPTTLTYNHEGYLQRVVSGSEYYINYIWANGNLIGAQSNDEGYDGSSQMSYTSESNNKTTIDLNMFIAYIANGGQSYFPVSLFGLIDKTGKRSGNYMLPIFELNSDRPAIDWLYTAKTEPMHGIISTTHTEGSYGTASYSFDAEGFPVAYTWQMAVTKSETIYAGVREYVEPKNENEAERWERQFGAGPWFRLRTTQKSYAAVIDTYQYTISYNR